jgi:hypothetical protein
VRSLSLLLLLCLGSPVLAQQFPDYIEKQIKSGVLTRDEAKQLYGLSTPQSNKSMPFTSPKVRPVSNEGLQTNYLATAKQYIRSQGMDLERMGEALDNTLLESAQSICQGANIANVPPRQISKSFMAGMKQLVAKDTNGMLPPNFPEVITEAMVQGLEKSKYCTTVATLSAQPQTERETRYLSFVKDRLEQRGLGMTLGNNTQKADAALLFAGKNYCKALSQGATASDLKSGSIAGGQIQSPGVSKQIGEAIVDIMMEGVTVELCPTKEF